MRKEILQFLQNVSIFQGLKPASLRRIYNNIEEVTIPSHEYIYERGKTSKNLYIIRYGEVMIRLGTSGKEVRYLESGDVLAENSLLTASMHSGSAIAVLDTLLYVINGKVFLELADQEKQLSNNLMKLMSGRMLDYLEEVKEGRGYTRRLIFHVPLEPIPKFKSKLQEIIRIARRAYPKKVKLIEADYFKDMTSEQATAEVAKMRFEYPVIQVYFKNPVGECPLDKLVMQADKIVLWESSFDSKEPRKKEYEDYWCECIRNFDERSVRMIDQGDAIHRQSYGGLRKVFIRKETLARFLVSKTRGLALGGGGARGLAHIGLLKVLEDENITIDYISGTSFGAVVAAFYAAGEPVSDIVMIMREFFGRVEKPFFDPILPIVSFYKGKKLIRMIKRAFGDLHIEDLRIPFVTSAVDLYSGKEIIYDKGPIWKALIATMSLPGVFPPFRYGEHLLVDGGILNNVPESLIRSRGADVIVSSNVAPLEDRAMVGLFQMKKFKGKFSLRMLWENIKYPPILKIIGRSITLEGRELTKMKIEKMDFFINLEMQEYSIFDFKKYKEIISLGEVQFRQYLTGVKQLFYPKPVNGNGYSKGKRK